MFYCIFSVALACVLNKKISTDDVICVFLVMQIHCIKMEDVECVDQVSSLL